MSGPGRMSGLVGPDVRARDPWMNTAWRGQIRGKIRKILWMEIGEKLDLPATHEIRGSNPTELHHTNKSQKKLGLFLWGNFRIRTKNNKIKLENKERGLRNRDQRGS